MVSRGFQRLGCMAAAALGILLGATALAEELHYASMLGNGCFALDSKHADDFSRDEGRLTNLASADREVVCPPPVVSGAYHQSLRLLINIHDGSPSATVSCTLHVRTEWSEILEKKNLVIDFPEDTKPHQGPAFTGKGWGEINVGNYADMQPRFFYVWCRLPPRSSLFSLTYYVR